MTPPRTARPGDAQPEAANTEPIYWTIRDIEHHCRVSRATAWRLVRSPDFPAPIVLGSKTIRWRRDEVIRFVDQRRHGDRYGVENRKVNAAAFTSRTVRPR